MITKESGIYKILNIITGDFYVGSTVNLRKRWNEHRRKLIKNLRENPYLQNAWNKYSELAFEFSVIELCEKEILLEREQYYMDLLKPTYNICLRAGNCLGVRHSDEARANMSSAHVGHIATEETRAKMSKVRKGTHQSIETRAKMSVAHKNRLPISEATRAKMCIAQKGNTNALGHVTTEESRAKMSIAKKGHHPSEETRANMSVAQKNRPPISEETRVKMSKASKGELNPMFGKSHTAESRAKVSASLIGNTRALGHKHSEETRVNMSEARMGHIVTEETRANMSISQKKSWVLRRET